MTDMRTADIPTLSLDDQAREPAAFAAAIGASFARFGFAIIADHGIPQPLIDSAWAETRALFDLPLAVKQGYRVADGAGARGYTAFGVEMAKGAEVQDLKEFWHVGREPSGDGACAGASDIGDMRGLSANIWPAERGTFQPVFQQMFAHMDHLGGQLLSAIARYLGLAPDWFTAAVADGNSVLRLLHYPPVSAAAVGVRAGAHEDIDLITLLLGAEEAGLELRCRDGQWLAVRPPAGAIVVNIGDMLQRLTNHVLPSTTHRVINPPVARRGASRYSMPFFLHPRPDFMIETLAGCIGPDRPNLYPVAISEQDFLSERLVEIGLKKPG